MTILRDRIKFRDHLALILLSPFLSNIMAARMRLICLFCSQKILWLESTSVILLALHLATHQYAHVHFLKRNNTVQISHDINISLFHIAFNFTWKICSLLLYHLLVLTLSCPDEKAERERERERFFLFSWIYWFRISSLFPLFFDIFFFEISFSWLSNTFPLISVQWLWEKNTNICPVIIIFQSRTNDEKRMTSSSRCLFLLCTTRTSSSNCEKNKILLIFLRVILSFTCIFFANVILVLLVCSSCATAFLVQNFDRQVCYSQVVRGNSS